MLVSVVRTLILYALILLSLRLMGKRQISQLQASELVVTLLLSELAVLPIQNHTEPLLEGIAPMVVLVLAELLIAWLMLKFQHFRQLICGRPTVVIQEGKIDQQAMGKLRMTTEELTEQLRQKDAFFLDEVAYAVVETNGSLSVVKYTPETPVTPKQLGLAVADRGIEAVVVSDGYLSPYSMNLLNLNADWVLKTLKAQGFTLKEVFIMTVDSQRSYKIVPNHLRKSSPSS